MSLIAHGTDPLNGAFMGFLLVTARFSGFFAVSPFFSRRVMSRLVRLAVIAALCFISAPGVIEDVQTGDRIADRFLFLALKELALGYFLGVLTWLPLRGLELVGVILDTQRGSMQSEDFDVVFNAQTTPTAIFLSQMFGGYFFASGGFLLVVSMLFDSIHFWPPTDSLPHIFENALILFIRLAGTVLFAAVAVALPISGFMLLADIVIAFLARSAQSLNALTFGMPVKSAILLIMLILYLDIAYPKIIAALAAGLTLLTQVLTP